GASFTFDVNLADGNAHQVALYAVDFENFGRSETIKILNATNNAVLDTRSITGFVNGVYEVWTLTGHVLIQVTNNSGNAVVSGLFFGLPPSPPPTANITTPASGASVSGSAVTVTATAAAT